MEEDVQGTSRAALRPNWGACALCQTPIPRHLLTLVRAEQVGEGKSEFLELCPDCKRRVETGEYLQPEE